MPVILYTDKTLLLRLEKKKYTESERKKEKFIHPAVPVLYEKVFFTNFIIAVS